MTGLLKVIDMLGLTIADTEVRMAAIEDENTRLRAMLEQANTELGELRGDGQVHTNGSVPLPGHPSLTGAIVEP